MEGLPTGLLLKLHYGSESVRIIRDFLLAYPIYTWLMTDFSRYNDTLLINFCKTLQNLGEESVSDLLMGEFQKLATNLSISVIQQLHMTIYI